MRELEKSICLNVEALEKAFRSYFSTYVARSFLMSPCFLESKFSNVSFSDFRFRISFL